MRDFTQVDILTARGYAIKQWLETTQVVDNTIGKENDGLWVKRVNIYSYQSPVTTYAGAPVKSSVRCPIMLNKALNVMDSLDVSEECLSKLHQLAEGQVLPLAVYMQLMIHCPSERLTGVVNNIELHANGVDIAISNINQETKEISHIAKVPVSDIDNKVFVGHRHHNYIKWLTVDNYGYIYPIVFTVGNNTVTLDNLLLCMKPKDGKVKAIGEWEGSVIKLYGNAKKTTLQAINSQLNGIVPYIAMIKDYIIPSGLCLVPKAKTTGEGK